MTKTNKVVLPEFPNNPIYSKEYKNPDFHNQWNVNQYLWNHYWLSEEIIKYYEQYFDYTFKLNQLENKSFVEESLAPELYPEYYFETKEYIIDIDLHIINLTTELESAKKIKTFSRKRYNELILSIEHCKYNKELFLEYLSKIKKYVRQNDFLGIDATTPKKGTNNLNPQRKFIWLESKTLLFVLFETLENLGFIYPENVSDILQHYFTIYNTKTKSVENLNCDTIKDYKSKVKSKTLQNKSKKMQDIVELLKHG